MKPTKPKPTEGASYNQVQTAREALNSAIQKQYENSSDNQKNKSKKGQSPEEEFQDPGNTHT